MSRQHQKSKEYIRDQFKNAFNIELIGFEKEVTPADCIKELQEKKAYEFIASDFGVNRISKYFEKDVATVK
jgi:hypothetical protein